MNSDKKLEYFTEAIDREVESKKRKARQQMTAQHKDEVSQAATEAKAEANTQNQAQIQAIQKVMNKRITEATTEARRSLSNLRERLTAQLFDQVKAEIVAYTQSPEYENFLVNSAKAAQSQSRDPYTFIQLTPEDMHLGEAIQKATGLTPEPGDASILGGFKLLTENRGKGAEFTLSARLTAARQDFAKELGGI